jgi:two-component system response regulator AtoC
MAARTVEGPETPAVSGDLPTALHLLVMGPEHASTHVLPTRGTMRIGRDENADVRLVDPLASRHHAHIHVGDGLEVEDLGSFNGTTLRGSRLDANQREALEIGDALAIGSTLLVVQRHMPPFKPRKVWPHGYFETRLIEECARSESIKGSFAILRLHFSGEGDSGRREERIFAMLRPGDILAAYGPSDYEILLVDTEHTQAETLAQQIVTTMHHPESAVRSGIANFPMDGNSPQALVAVACSRVREDGADSRALPDTLVLENSAMRALYLTAEKAAKGTINVLICGETGSGKEILADTVHRLSPRATGPFICLNCAALTEQLLESELFGYERGAFTGAVQAKQGLLEAASGGTLFLDEVGEMSLGLQAKVLRAIETRTVLRVGATKPRTVDVRFIAATNRDLEEEVAAKRFREDLYFRLNAITLTVPPLRERTDEIAPLARRFLGSVAQQLGRSAPELSLEALRLLEQYSWPGNIRELRNVMERAILLSSGPVVTSEYLPADRMRRRSVLAVEAVSNLTQTSSSEEPQRAPLALSLREHERQAIVDALARCRGNQTRAAELLGMPRRTFCTRLRDLNVPRPRV